MNQSSIGLRFRFDGGDFGNGIPNIAIQHRRSLEDTRVCPNGENGLFPNDEDGGIPNCDSDVCMKEIQQSCRII